MGMQACTGISGLTGLIPSGLGLGVTILQDAFTDTNGLSLNSHTMNVGTGWIQRNGSFTIQSNQVTDGGTGSGNLGTGATADAGQANVTAQVDIVASTADSVTEALLGRYLDVNNFWLVGILVSGPKFRILEINAGVATERAAATQTLTNGVTYTVRAAFNGTTITATINGANQISYSSASLNSTGTLYGIRSNRAGQIFDNFLVTT